jgi:hypothetical protein
LQKHQILLKILEFKNKTNQEKMSFIKEQLHKKKELIQWRVMMIIITLSGLLFLWQLNIIFGKH